MTKIFSNKKVQNKFFVVVSVVIALVLSSFTPLCGVSFNANAAEMPTYNPEYGNFTQTTDDSGNLVLTAVPKEQCGFRGWFNKNGEEVSLDSEFVLPSGSSADDYIPVFYNFNLAVNGSFEEYADGKNLKKDLPEQEIWEGVCDSEVSGEGDWTSATVTSERARSGSKSLKAFSQFNTTYHTFYNLEKNVQYTLSFWYNLDSNNNNFLSFVNVLGENAEVSATANSNNGESLAHKSFSEAEGSTAENEWKQAKVTFYSGDNTSVKLAILYASKNSEGTPAGASIYIDDVALIKDVAAAPEYINEDFTRYTKNWQTMDIRCLTTEHTSGRLKVNSIIPLYGHVQSPVIRVKKGAEYNFKFSLDLSEITDLYVPKFELKNYSDYVVLTDESLISEDNPNGYVWDADANGNKKPNWINFYFGTEYLKHSSFYGSNSGSVFSWKVSDVNGTSYSLSGGEFGKQTLSNQGIDVSKPVTVEVAFTAKTTDDIYLNVRLNGLGTYYLDDVVITEDASNIDFNDLIKTNTLKTKGTAIRTVGKQGMRNKTTLDKLLLTAENSYGARVIEYGTIAIKSEYLNGAELTVDGEYDYGEFTYGVKVGAAYSFSDKTDLVFSEKQTTLDFTGVLTNISEENWNTDYTARAYAKYILKDGTQGIVYGDSADIAVYPISKMAYTAKNSSGNYAESTAVRNYLYINIISKFADKIITVNNDSEPIWNNFQGIGSTVYHGTAFFPDSHGRTYTEKEAAMEMDRLVDSGIDNVRTRFASQWMWKDGTGWNWDSDKMIAFYKWAKMLQDRDISITLNAGWDISDYALYYTSKSHSSIPEVNYLHGYTNANQKTVNIYSEDQNSAGIETAGRTIGLDFTDDEYAHYSVAAARYGEWIKQGLNALKAHGVNNVEYILPFTETGYQKADDSTYCYDEWILMALGLNNALEKEGMRKDYQMIGPSQSLYKNQNRKSLLEYTYEKFSGTKYESLIDINSSHAYTKPNTELGYDDTVYEPYASYSMAEENFKYYDDLLTKINQREKTFWCDEYFAHAGDIRCWDGVGMQAVQFAAGFTAGANNGMNRMVVWQLFDTLRDSRAAYGTAYIDRATEFIGGVHAVGACPSFVFADGFNCPNGEDCGCHNYYSYSSYLPRTTYYGINLIGKYMNNKNASVYNTSVTGEVSEFSDGLYVSAIKNDDGNTVILVVNTENNAVNVNVQLEKNTDISYKRYTYEPKCVVPTSEATSIPSDKDIAVYGMNEFSDVVPARSFSIYVSSSGGFMGGDAEIPF